MRLLKGIRAFGEAMTMAHVGGRFSEAIVEAPSGLDAYVKRRHDDLPTGAGKVVDILAQSAARAMERIYRTQDGRVPESVLQTSANIGRNQLFVANKILYELMYEDGLNPQSRIDHDAVEGMGRYAPYAGLSPEQTKEIGDILLVMENKLVADLLSAHDPEWYRQRILDLTRKGSMTEAEFYQLIGYRFPGENSFPLGENIGFGLFRGEMEPPPKEVSLARDFKQGATQTTARENLTGYIAILIDTIRERAENSVDARRVSLANLDRERRKLDQPTSRRISGFDSTAAGGSCESLLTKTN